MKFRRVVINAGKDGFVQWILNRQYYKLIEISFNNEFYVVDIRLINDPIPNLLFIAVDHEKYFADPDEFLLSVGNDHVEGDEGDKQNSDIKESEKVDKAQTISKAEQSEDVDADDKLFIRLAEDQQMMKEIIYGPNQLLSQAFLISLASDRTEAYFVLYSGEIENYVNSLIEEINSYWSVTVNEPISSENWYQNYSFSTMMYPLEQNGLSDEVLVEQIIPSKRKIRSKGKKALIPTYNISPNIYSNEVEDYEWISDVDFMKQYFDGYSIFTMELIITNFRRAHDRYVNEGGQWGPNQIAFLIHLNADYVGKYLKALRKMGVVSIDGMDIPYKSRVNSSKNVKGMSKP